MPRGTFKGNNGDTSNLRGILVIIKLRLCVPRFLNCVFAIPEDWLGTVILSKVLGNVELNKEHNILLSY